MASHRADQGDLQAAFDELSKAYLTVNGEVDRSHNPWTLQSWKSVNAAYRDLENHMHSYG